MEDWRSVKGFENFYEVSSLGRVRRTAGGRGAVAGKILGLRIDSKGYPQVFLHAIIGGEKVRVNRKVHHLVLEVFIGPRPTDHHETNHRNGKKVDNRPKNLEWLLPQENIEHSWRLGLRHYIGEKNWTAKLTEEQAREIIRLKGSVSQRELAMRYGVHVNQIKAIHAGRSWRHLTAQPQIVAYLRERKRSANYMPKHGELNGNAILTTPQVIQIKRMIPTASNKEVAACFGVSHDTIYRIRRGTLWQHVSTRL